MPVSDLTEIGPDDEEEEEEEPLGRGRAWSGAAADRRRRPLDRGQSCECYPMSREYAADPATDRRAPPPPPPPPEHGEKGAGECTCRSDAAMANGGGGGGGKGERDEESPTLGRRAERSPGGDEDEDDGGSLGRLLYAPNNHMTKSMLCLNEETQDEVGQISVSLA